jgi:hypothetical protein
MEISMPKRDGVQRKFILCKTINRSQAKEYWEDCITKPVFTLKLNWFVFWVVSTWCSSRFASRISNLREHVSVVLSAENQRQFFVPRTLHMVLWYLETATFFSYVTILQ